MLGKQWGWRIVEGFKMPFYMFFVFTIVLVTFYSEMVEIFKVRQTEWSWKTVVFTGSEVKSQAEVIGPVLCLAIEADTNFYKDKTKSDAVNYVLLDLLFDFHFYPLISFRFWHTSESLSFGCILSFLKL